MAVRLSKVAREFNVGLSTIVDYLQEKGITSYIKLQDHEKRKSRTLQENIGKYYNMKYEVY